MHFIHILGFVEEDVFDFGVDGGLMEMDFLFVPYYFDYLIVIEIF